MEKKRLAEDLVRQLALRFRVVTLDGVAVITHGLSRNTHDLDVWIDPMESPEAWCRTLWPWIMTDSKVTIIDIGSFSPVEEGIFPEVINHDGVVRVSGLDRPLDIFRRPKDTYDIQFLEGKAEAMYLERLPKAAAGEALKMLERFLNPKVAAAAARHPDPVVREAGLGFLRELAEEGDPFARDLLAEFGGGLSLKTVLGQNLQDEQDSREESYRNPLGNPFVRYSPTINQSCKSC